MPFNTAMATPRSKLLYQEEEAGQDSYCSANKKPSYYKRSQLLQKTNSSSSFRQKYKGFRTRSSSYTSLEDEKMDDNLLTTVPSAAAPTSPSFFSRKKLGDRSSTAPASYLKRQDKDEDYEQQVEQDDDNEECTFFAKKDSYSRQNLGNNRSSSWKLCVLKAVGVKK